MDFISFGQWVNNSFTGCTYILWQSKDTDILISWQNHYEDSIILEMTYRLNLSSNSHTNLKACLNANSISKKATVQSFLKTKGAPNYSQRKYHWPTTHATVLFDVLAFNIFAIMSRIVKIVNYIFTKLEYKIFISYIDIIQLTHWWQSLINNMLII